MEPVDSTGNELRPLRKRVRNGMKRKKLGEKWGRGIGDGTGEGGTPPHYMDECQNKGDRKWAIRKRMKTKEGRKFGGDCEKAVERVGVNG